VTVERRGEPSNHRNGRVDHLDRAVEQVALVDLLDRLLAGGVVLTGDVTISLAGVDLVHVSLRALISSAATLLDKP
jgi:hypothetical protein